MTATAEPLTVVIASPLEADLVERIRAAEPERVRVVFEPDLIPRARYVADHDGIRPDVDAAGIDRWRSILASADIMFDVDWYAPKDLPTNAPRLRWIQATRSGVGEHLRRQGLDRSSIIVTNASGVHAVPLAEFVVLGLMWLVKEVPRFEAEQARHHWEQSRTGQLAGMRVLLVGLGGLGRRIARVLAGLDVDVWGYRRSEAPAPDGVSRMIAPGEFREALREVDGIVVACPLTDETRHLVGAAELAALRPGAFVINVARGGVIDEAALVDAIKSGHLGGAALDVYESEPLSPDSPLWDLPNVLLSPHRASIVDAENGLIVDIFIDNLHRYLDGRPLRNLYERDRGY